MKLCVRQTRFVWTFRVEIRGTKEKFVLTLKTMPGEIKKEFTDGVVVIY